MLKISVQLTFIKNMSKAKAGTLVGFKSEWNAVAISTVARGFSGNTRTLKDGTFVGIGRSVDDVNGRSDYMLHGARGTRCSYREAQAKGLLY